MSFSTKELAELDQRFRTNLINSITGFKSVSLVGTFNNNRETNLAIISQIIHIGANPPLIGLLFRPNVVVRHTLENILASECFTINHIKRDFLKQAHHTSARWSESEFTTCGLAEEYLDDFSAPYVKESSIKLGCTLAETMDVKSNGTHFIIGAIEHLHAPDTFIGSDGFVDLEAAGTVTCSGLDSYHQTKKIARYTYAKPEYEPKEV